MEFSGSNIKKFFIFSQKKAFLIFQEAETPKKFLIFQERKTLKSFLYSEKQNFPSLKNKKPTLKMFLTFWEMKLYEIFCLFCKLSW